MDTGIVVNQGILLLLSYKRSFVRKYSSSCLSGYEELVVCKGRMKHLSIRELLSVDEGIVVYQGIREELSVWG